MNIALTELIRQARKARELWGSVIDHIEAEFGFPLYLMYAVGSRETNLSPYYASHPGDGGHGHGLWQVDDRSHQIPADWANNIEWQCRRGAEVLQGAYRKCGTWQGALAAYNSGRCEDRFTTGKDYGRDTWERRDALEAALGPPKKKRRWRREEDER